MSQRNPDLSPEESAAFAQSAANVQRAVADHLSANASEQYVVAFVRNLHRATDQVVDGTIQRGARVDCKAGCSHCCSARVDAIAPEIFRIAAKIEQGTPAERAAVIERLSVHAAAPDELTDSWKLRRPCPFLADNLCSIYDVRPTACRKAHSTDVHECEAGAPAIPQNLEIALSAEALIMGTAAAYRERGLDASSHELVRAVLVVLLDASAEARWYQGERIFQARGEGLGTRG